MRASVAFGDQENRGFALGLGQFLFFDPEGLMDGVGKSVPIEGFDQITRRLDSLGTCNGRFVGVCGEKTRLAFASDRR